MLELSQAVQQMVENANAAVQQEVTRYESTSSSEAQMVVANPGTALWSITYNTHP